jgi:aldehyde:ferredoxin oxidoreductase
MKFTLVSANGTEDSQSAAGLLKCLFGGNEMNLAKLEKLIEYFTGTETEHTLRWAADTIRELQRQVNEQSAHQD